MGVKATDLRKTFRAAIPPTLPIAAGFLFLGGSYGLLMHAKGFAIWYPLSMAYFIFAGSMEFVTVNLLLSAFDPLAAFLLAIMVNARHLFYGLSMLGRFRGTGWKKPNLIFTMIDETFAINQSVRPPANVDRNWFMMFVSMLCRTYWLTGTTLGWLVGGPLPFSTKGIEFVLTALFLTIFLDQWNEDGAGVEHDEMMEVEQSGKSAPTVPSISTIIQKVDAHLPALVGLLAPAVCLMTFGPDRFMIPSMATMFVLFMALRSHLTNARNGVTRR